MANPKVNVLIANYNYGEWVIDAIESAINQTYPDISITIVDDCSTDDSWYKIYKHVFQSRSHNKFLPSDYDIRTCEIVKDKKTIPVTAIRLNKNSGPSFARNIGIFQTLKDSDYYMILDADDIMYNHKVWRCVEAAMRLPQLYGVIYGDYMTLNVETGLERIEYKPNFDINTLYKDCIIHSGSLVSKEALLSVQAPYGFYDPELRVCEDYDLWLRITQHFSALHLQECLTLVRVSPKNSSNTVDNNIRQSCLRRIGDKMGGGANV